MDSFISVVQEPKGVARDSRINFFLPGRVLAGPGFQDFQSEKHAFSSESCNNPITLAELSFVEAIITFPLLEISRGC